MKRLVEKKVMKKWAKSVGGTGKAAKMLIDATDIAPTTAERLARGVYPSEPQFLVRKAICDLTGLSEDVLFPVVSATRTRAS